MNKFYFLKIRGKRFLKILFWIGLCLPYNLLAQEPTGYYDAALGKKDKDLKTALFKIIRPHKQLNYLALPTAFQSTDWHPATSTSPKGYYWDMYSSNQHSTWSKQELNREHNMPKSWFGVSSDQVNDFQISTDLNNLYPSDINANSAKLNYALGVVSNSAIFSNGVVKVGSNSFPGYNGTVFEPANEYKGDFARDYMYMVTCYEDYANTWQSIGTSSMLIRGSYYPVLNAYAVNLLLQWHRQDAVSSKEVTRNNAVYSLQNNRNPYIDYPVLAEYIWGKFIGETWDGSNDDPENNSPLKALYSATDKSVFVSIKNPQAAFYSIFSVFGMLKQSGEISETSKISLNKENKIFDKGIYLIVVYTGNYRKSTRFLVY
ncbi:MAG: hypothetical protein AUK44_01365 [Porphyromonadaceae bacterium CG2_30_38_12]|nr:MAG: hypothetical protein AUK44_01365 [Porphyromonadaceae bacterium CG2_30_38_12]